MRPWPAKTDCPDPAFPEFKQALMDASYHNAGPNNEMGSAKKRTKDAAVIAVDADWPFWAMQRMFRDIAPLVDWDTFMQSYIDELKNRIVK